MLTKLDNHSATNVRLVQILGIKTEPLHDIWATQGPYEKRHPPVSPGALSCSHHSKKIHHGLSHSVFQSGYAHKRPRMNATSAVFQAIKT